MDALCTNRQRGFTYLALMFVTAIGAAALAAAGTVWHTEVRRAKEAQLLFIGEEFKNAIASYYHATPGRAKELPRKLEDLLRDPRYPTPKRHLRKIYVDPMTGKAEWGLVVLPEGIHGVHSLSTLEPFKGRNSAAVAASAASVAAAAKGGGAPVPLRPRYVDWNFIADLSRLPPTAADAKDPSAAAAPNVRSRVLQQPGR